MEKEKEVLGDIAKEKNNVKKMGTAKEKECVLREVDQDLMAKEAIQRIEISLQMMLSSIIKYQRLWNKKFTL